MQTQHTRPTLALVVLVVAAVVLVAVDGSMRAMTTRAQRLASAELTPFELERRNQSAFARMLGDFRASAADVMFVKTELYLHGGMSWQPHLDSNQMAASGVVVDNIDPTKLRSEILSRDVDFRGILGDLERAVKPYDPRHRETEKDELLPWYRVMTVVDPHFIRGYRIGTFWLMARKEAQSWREAEAFLQEGLKNNAGAPEEFRLWTSAAMYYQKRYAKAQKEPDFLGDDAMELAKKAYECATKAYELGLAERPANGEVGAFGPNLMWSDDLEEDFKFGARFVPMMVREIRGPEAALEALPAVRAVLPNDKPLRNFQWDIERELKEKAERIEAPAGVLIPEPAAGAPAK